MIVAMHSVLSSNAICIMGVDLMADWKGFSQIELHIPTADI